MLNSGVASYASRCESEPSEMASHAATIIRTAAAIAASDSGVNREANGISVAARMRQQQLVANGGDDDPGHDRKM